MFIKFGGIAEPLEAIKKDEKIVLGVVARGRKLVRGWR
jgi:hypothetical protein